VAKAKVLIEDVIDDGKLKVQRTLSGEMSQRKIVLKTRRISLNVTQSSLEELQLVLVQLWGFSSVGSRLALRQERAS